MGNQNFLEEMKDANHCPTAKQFDLEDMIQEEFLQDMFQKFYDETGLYGLQSPNEGNFFFNKNKQEEKVDREKGKQNFFEELHELYTSGLCRPEYIREKLKESRFKKYFTFEAENWNNKSRQCDRLFYQKFFILYCYIAPYYLKQGNEKYDYLKRYSEYLSNNKQEKIESYTLIMGMIFSFTILKELKHKNPSVLQKSLLHMHSSLLSLKEHSFESLCKDFTNKRDEIFHTQRDFLVSLVEDTEIPQESKELALRIIVLFGKIRSSGEDFLVVLNLVNKYQIGINLANELNFRVSKAEGVVTDSQEKHSFAIGSESFQTKVNLLTGMNDSPSPNDSLEFCMDEGYLYMTVTGKGVFKVGYKNSVQVKAGLTYAKNMFRDYKKKTITVVGDKVYIRQNEDSSNPLVILNKHTLEVLKDDDIIKDLAENKRNYEEDDWNKIKYEITDKDRLKDIITKSIRGSFR